MRQSELKAILKDHKLWSDSSGSKGKRASLYGAYLEDANLEGADLRCASLHGANLHGANLQGANLRGAYLRGAKFTTNFKRVSWFAYATFSEDQLPWVVLNPKYPEWAHTLKWVKAKADAA